MAVHYSSSWGRIPPPFLVAQCLAGGFEGVSIIFGVIGQSEQGEKQSEWPLPSVRVLQNMLELWWHLGERVTSNSAVLQVCWLENFHWCGGMLRYKVQF
ncbi:hypothetical protein O6P43_013421 [Quillaja saponaria]|uniref:Uncharacterized protein n=1 Tax=Quillaja saponaria TaxID=32244 RepID=A0AAD7M4A9_QUISA|nr:hypothetical protein O6P43_013421 [Quillaja saponaria]